MIHLFIKYLSRGCGICLAVYFPRNNPSSILSWVRFIIFNLGFQATRWFPMSFYFFPVPCWAKMIFSCLSLFSDALWGNRKSLTNVYSIPCLLLAFLRQMLHRNPAVSTSLVLENLLIFFLKQNSGFTKISTTSWDLWRFKPFKNPVVCMYFYVFLVDTLVQLLVNWWFGARWFGIRIGYP